MSFSLATLQHNNSLVAHTEERQRGEETTTSREKKMNVENGKRKCRRRFKFNLLIFSCYEIIKLELLLSAWVIYAQMVNLNSLHTSSGLHRAEERKSGPTHRDEKF